MAVSWPLVHCGVLQALLVESEWRKLKSLHIGIEGYTIEFFGLIRKIGKILNKL